MEMRFAKHTNTEKPTVLLPFVQLYKEINEIICYANQQETKTFDNSKFHC